jgi:hypothetical protein
MQPDYEIVLGRGIGALLFGISKGDLTGILGTADEISTPEEVEKSHWERYTYNAINCSFSFDPARGDRLVEFIVENGYFHLFHKIRVGVKKEYLLATAASLNFGDSVTEDLETGELIWREAISWSRVGLMVFLEDGIVSMLQLSPLTDEKGKFIWPEAPVEAIP